MKIFITGSAGFIGRHVVRELRSHGHQVIGFDLKESERPLEVDFSHKGNLLDKDELTQILIEQRPEAVIHLAAKTSMKTVPPGSDHFAANTIGTQNLMEAIRACSSVRRAIYTSTKYVFRDPPPVPHRIYRPETSYGASKAEMEERIWDDGGGGCEWALVRPTTIWGPGMGRHYRSFLEMIRTGRYVHLGEGTARKHLGYVGNVAYQYRRMLEAPAAEISERIFYTGDYEPWCLRDWAEAFREVFASPTIRTIPLPVARLAGRAGDALVRSGWRKFPFTSFRLRNLTEDDLCDMESMREVAGPAPVAPAEAVARTAAWHLTEPTQVVP